MQNKIKFWKDKTEIINYLKDVNNKYDYIVEDNNEQNKEEYFYKFTIKSVNKQQTYYVEYLDWNLSYFRKAIKNFEK